MSVRAEGELLILRWGAEILTVLVCDHWRSGLIIRIETSFGKNETVHSFEYEKERLIIENMRKSNFLWEFSGILSIWYQFIASPSIFVIGNFSVVDLFKKN